MWPQGYKENNYDHFFARYQAGQDRHAADPGGGTVLCSKCAV
jgi:hypothetical protein